MKKLLIFLLAIVVLFLLGCDQEYIGPSSDCHNVPASLHPNAPTYQAVLDHYTSKGLPGISLLVRDHHGTWVGGSGHADISHKIPMQPCTISKAASITKSFIGVLTMRLVEEGHFGLDDSVSKWLEAKVIDPVENANQSTVRMLLNHTTGIADLIKDQEFYLSILNDPAHTWTPSELLHFVDGDEAVFAPGAKVEYSNTNYLLLAMVIEAATGEHHAELLRNRVIEPLGLADTYYYWHDELPETTAQGYFDLYNNGTILNMTNYNTGSGNGYGGLYSNVYDLQVFIESLVRDEIVLREETLKEMMTWTEPQEGKDRAHGLGLFKDFLERPEAEYGIGHRGRDLGYTADMYWFPEQDYTLVYLVNYGTDAKSELQETFFDFRTAVVDAMMGT